jgi:TRAP-type C4-dicarboxylate transport system substrate-binding protein
LRRLVTGLTRKKRVKFVIKNLARWLLLAMALLPTNILAGPVRLKLTMVTSDRSLLYLASVKPFVDAVNAEAKGLIEIEVHFSEKLGKTQLPQMVTDGTADLALILPGYSPECFSDNTVIELPGLFQDTREASTVFTRLIAAGALQGYENFHVIGAYTTPLETIHSRLPIASMDDLKGMRIRVSSMTEVAALQRLGVRPVLMPATIISEAISDGTVDGATFPPALLFEFGVGRVTGHHYLLNISVASLALVMNRNKFESLPEQAQNVIRKHSGEWPLASFVQSFDAVNQQVMEQLASNSHRKIVFPLQTDRDTAKAAFQAFVDEWAAKNPNNRKQLEIVQAEIAKLRASQ